MNCYMHTDQEATVYCRSCGRPLCGACQKIAQGTVFCAEHVPAVAAEQPSPSPSSPPASISPGLAFVLGLIPGVGAIYNGQYAKGVVHVVILGSLISIMDSGAVGSFAPMFGLLIALWFFYMAFEAYHTASKRLRGEPVDEFSSLMPLRSPQASSIMTAAVLILLGGLFLLMNLRPEWTYIIFKLWPVALIAAGLAMLVARWKNRDACRQKPEEVPHEQL
jgi:hypothetical protein